MDEGAVTEPPDPATDPDLARIFVPGIDNATYPFCRQALWCHEWFLDPLNTVQVTHALLMTVIFLVVVPIIVSIERGNLQRSRLRRSILWPIVGLFSILSSLHMTKTRIQDDSARELSLHGAVGWSVLAALLCCLIMDVIRFFVHGSPQFLRLWGALRTPVFCILYTCFGWVYIQGFYLAWGFPLLGWSQAEGHLHGSGWLFIVGLSALFSPYNQKVRNEALIMLVGGTIFTCAAAFIFEGTAPGMQKMPNQKLTMMSIQHLFAGVGWLVCGVLSVIAIRCGKGAYGPGFVLASTVHVFIFSFHHQHIAFSTVVHNCHTLVMVAVGIARCLRYWFVTGAALLFAAGLLFIGQNGIVNHMVLSDVGVATVIFADLGVVFVILSWFIILFGNHSNISFVRKMFKVDSDGEEMVGQWVQYSPVNLAIGHSDCEGGNDAS